MATILELVSEGRLIKLDPQLGERELEERQIFLLAETAVKAALMLESMESEWNIESSPAEQLDEFVHYFATGGMLNFPRQFHSLTHRRDGIWELKTQDLRLFGWFVAKDCYICSDIANANEVKRMRMYAGYCEQAWFRRDQLELNDPKYVHGKEPKDVISNCYIA